MTRHPVSTSALHVMLMFKSNRYFKMSISRISKVLQILGVFTQNFLLGQVPPLCTSFSESLISAGQGLLSYYYYSSTYLNWIKSYHLNTYFCSLVFVKVLKVNLKVLIRCIRIIKSHIQFLPFENGSSQK